ncbi:MAG: ATP-binding protein [bacterium]
MTGEKITPLNPRGENLSSVVEMLCREPTRKESLLSWIRALTPMDASDLMFKHDHSGRVLMYLVERSGTEISAASASDGTLRFLAMATALLGKDNGQLFFLEEFDNGIHPTRLHLLLQLFEQATRQSGIQVVATTHNPAVLTFLSADQRSHTALVLREGDESRIVRLRDLPDISRVLESEDLGHLLASGWLDDAAALDPELPR